MRWLVSVQSFLSYANTSGDFSKKNQTVLKPNKLGEQQITRLD